MLYKTKSAAFLKYVLINVCQVCATEFCMCPGTTCLKAYVPIPCGCSYPICHGCYGKWLHMSAEPCECGCGEFAGKCPHCQEFVKIWAGRLVRSVKKKAPRSQESKILHLWKTKKLNEPISLKFRCVSLSVLKNKGNYKRKKTWRLVWFAKKTKRTPCSFEETRPRKRVTLVEKSLANGTPIIEKRV